MNTCLVLIWLKVLAQRNTHMLLLKTNFWYMSKLHVNDIVLYFHFLYQYQIFYCGYSIVGYQIWSEEDPLFSVRCCWTQWTSHIRSLHSLCQGSSKRWHAEQLPQQAQCDTERISQHICSNCYQRGSARLRGSRRHKHRRSGTAWALVSYQWFTC